ncbi:protein of unknown function [Limimonas halophila]|uniref:DUF4340 domain-containing protein n=1 Tax=Limimonas halophila TaxID=1082479 RepID=A0A1G7MAV8_9PROT|nr:DUF4340 domain-containing protein [Limimonas halophila]SDF58280.1 protein of unknown function [Limimonas halophila]
MAPQRGGASRDPVRLAIIGLAALVVLILVIGFGVVRDAGFFGMADPVRSIVFPDLKGQLERVERVEVAGPKGEVTLTRDGDGWSVVQKNGYPAQAEQITAMLNAITGMPALQRLDTGEAQFDGLGVAADSEEGTRVTLSTGEGERLRTILIGMEKAAPGAEDLEAYYVRASDSQTVWLADADLAFPADPMAWLDTEAFAVPRARIRAVKTAPASGQPVHIRRDGPEDATFAGVGLPSDIELEGDWVLGELVVPFQSVQFSDVRRADEPLQPGGDEQGYVTTFDGVKIWYTLESRDGGQWARFAVESVAKTTADAEQGAAEDGENGPPVTAEDLNTRLSRWQFRLPEFHAQRMSRSIADLPRKGVGATEGATTAPADADAEGGGD